MPPTPLHLPLGPEPVLAFLHEPVDARRGPAVLFLPPFGWEDVCSYRPRREWGEHLAARGHAVLRLDLPGTGDSAGGPRDPGRVAAWLTAAREAVGWLRLRAGTDRVAAIGLGLGGLLAARSGAEDLVLWGAPARGATLVRELRAFSRFEAMQFRDFPPPPEDLLVAAGYVLTPETQAALVALDLIAAPPDARRVLLLGREGMGVDQTLRSHLEASGVEVAIAPGPGWAAMMAEPQQARAPQQTFAIVDDWLGPAGPAAPRPAPTLDGLNLPGLRETPFSRDGLFGVLTEPTDVERASLTAVLLNAGAQRHTGPNRMWVEAARRWALDGVPTLRLDLAGFGDSEGDASRYTEVGELYDPALVAQVRSVLDGLAARGVPEAFALGGLCSGAYWAFHTALEDPRARAVLALNPRVLFWDPQIDEERESRKAGKALSGESWGRLVRGELSAAQFGVTGRALVRRAVAAPARRRTRRAAPPDPLPAALDTLRDRGVPTLLAFSGEEPLHEELDRDGQLAQRDRWPGLHLAELPGAVHTLRPLPAQAVGHAVLDDALRRGLTARR